MRTNVKQWIIRIKTNKHFIRQFQKLTFFECAAIRLLLCGVLDKFNIKSPVIMYASQRALVNGGAECGWFVGDSFCGLVIFTKVPPPFKLTFGICEGLDFLCCGDNFGGGLMTCGIRDTCRHGDFTCIFVEFVVEMGSDDLFFCSIASDDFFCFIL